MKAYLIAATALLAGTALAQTAPVAQTTTAQAAAPAPMARDAVTTRAEMVAMVREHFGKLDSNKDGTVTKEEVSEGHPRMAKRLEGKHGDGPHGMMADGPARDPNAAFDRLDANKDGSISREEFTKAREERIERRIVMREEMKDGKAGGEHGMAMHRGGGGHSRMIVMADGNKDGKITLAEAEAMALKHFDEMDANKDGQLTPEEKRSGRKMMIHKVKEKTAS